MTNKDRLDYDNYQDVLQVAAQKQFEALLPQMLIHSGSKVDVVRATNQTTQDSVYGQYAGTKDELVVSFSTRVLGLPLSGDRVSMVNNEISGFFEGSEDVYALSDPELQTGDMLVIPDTGIKFLVIEPRLIGSDQQIVISFKVSSVQ